MMLKKKTRLNIKPDTSKGIRISTIMDDSKIDESTDPADEVAVLMDATRDR